MQETLDKALADGDIDNEVHALVKAALEGSPAQEGLKAGAVDSFLAFIKWLQVNLPMLQQNLQLILSVLNQLIQPKA